MGKWSQVQADADLVDAEHYVPFHFCHSAPHVDAILQAVVVRADLIPVGCVSKSPLSESMQHNLLVSDTLVESGSDTQLELLSLDVGGPLHLAVQAYILCNSSLQHHVPAATHHSLTTYISFNFSSCVSTSHRSHTACHSRLYLQRFGSSPEEALCVPQRLGVDSWTSVLSVTLGISSVFSEPSPHSPHARPGDVIVLCSMPLQSAQRA